MTYLVNIHFYNDLRDLLNRNSPLLLTVKKKLKQN